LQSSASKQFTVENCFFLLDLLLCQSKTSHNPIQTFLRRDWNKRQSSDYRAAEPIEECKTSGLAVRSKCRMTNVQELRIRFEKNCAEIRTIAKAAPAQGANGIRN
jgi:hypothetical protein